MVTERTKSALYALKEFVASRVPMLASRCSDNPATRDSSRLKRGPPICCPPAMYRLPAATTTPRSTSSVSGSIWRGSSLPSAIVTTTVGAEATSNP